MKTIRIGRSHSNDCVLANPSVSGTHAILTLDSDEQNGVLKDLNSKNGTYVNNKAIREVRVARTDSVRFGSEVMTIGEIIVKANSNRTRVERPVGAEQRIVGKGSDCQIRFTQDDVSRRHAILYKTFAGEVVIEDCDSTNGTYVNGVKIRRQTLHPGDKVTITRNYLLNWESYFRPADVHKSVPASANRTFAMVGAVVLCVLLCGLGYYGWRRFISPWDKERIYETYHSSVCWVYVEYGYTIKLNGEDITPAICRICEMTPDEHVYISDGKLKSGTNGAQGTAFFISNDGKLATNLHITRPWLYSDECEKLENFSNQLISSMAVKNPTLNRSKIEVIGEVTNMFIVPNGLPVSSDNSVRCSEKRGYDDVNKDVAIIQTDTRGLPASVKQIIDITQADTSEEALKEGKPLYTIGFPYGVGIALNDNKELKNQVHGGSVTQNRGDFEFGHDAATASGASGSPILNDKGRLVGIHHAGMTGATGAQGFNMGIKVKYILELLNQ